jgi:putative transposase
MHPREPRCVMARALRIEFPGALYHVTSRGNEQRRIFYSNADREAFLGFLASAVRRFGWSVTAWVLMTNHYHLVIQTPEPNLSRGMHWLNGTYAGWFNHRHNRAGHLFQGRFKAVLVDKDTYFTDVIRYVALNPVRAGMVDKAESYRWSSYRATAGLETAPAWLDTAAVLDAFDHDPGAAKAQYCDFVSTPKTDEQLWDRLINGMYLGTDEWAKQMRSLVESRPRSTDHPKNHRAVGRPKMHEVVAAVARASGEPAAAIREKRGGPLRRLAAWLGWHEGLLTLRSIAAALRLRSEGHISGLIKRCETEFNTNRALLANLDLALSLLRT